MPEVIHPTQLERPGAKKGFGIFDILVFVIIGIVIVALALTLMNKLSLKHEVAGAKVVADRTIADITKQNGADARGLGDKKFQAANSAQKLSSIFKAASTFAKGTPSIVSQTVGNGTNAQNVIFVYKYGGKTPYYFRVVTSKPDKSSTWQLIGISGSTSEAGLVQ